MCGQNLVVILSGIFEIYSLVKYIQDQYDSHVLVHNQSSPCFYVIFYNIFDCDEDETNEVVNTRKYFLASQNCFVENCSNEHKFLKYKF